jgi:hypothetical protein
MKDIKSIVLSIVTLVVMLFQLMSPAFVLAKGETPAPPSDASAESTIPPIKPMPTDILPTETPTPDALSPISTDPSSLTPTAPASQTSLPAESSTSTQSPSHERPSKTAEPTQPPQILNELALPTEVVAIEQPTLLESVQTMTKDTNVVVLDARGQPVPLASQEAAQGIAQSDPVWCPAGQAPTPGANGCTISYLTLADLVTNEGTNIAADGTIWITSGPVADATTATLDGCIYDADFNCTLTNWSIHALTLQGGWSGISGDTSTGSNSAFSVPISILNWNNNITVNNVTVIASTSPIPWTDITAGLYVQVNNGNIAVNNVDITLNGGNGVESDGAHLSTTNGNITISSSNFTNKAISAPDSRGAGANVETSNGDITVNNSNFNNNTDIGLQAISWNGNITINNSNFDNNDIGVRSFSDDTINNSTFSNNYYGILIGSGSNIFNNSIFLQNQVGIASTAVFNGTCPSETNIVLNNVIFSGNTTNIDDSAASSEDFSKCRINIVTSLMNSILLSQGEGEFFLDCRRLGGYSVNLPNGDRVQIFCPVSGSARISRLDNTALPAALPVGYTYASAFSLDIRQNKIPIPVITEGGSIKASFVATSLQTGSTYSVLYWDNGTWIPLKDFMLKENGNVQVFDLNSDVPEDTRKILSGVKLVTQNGSPRVEVSTNFPGIFVLAQH